MGNDLLLTKTIMEIKSKPFFTRCAGAGISFCDSHDKARINELREYFHGEHGGRKRLRGIDYTKEYVELPLPQFLIQMPQFSDYLHMILANAIDVNNADYIIRFQFQDGIPVFELDFYNGSESLNTHK